MCVKAMALVAPCVDGQEVPYSGCTAHVAKAGRQSHPVPIEFPSIQLPQAVILPSAVRQTISINPMDHVVLPIISSSDFQSILNTALERYENMTKKKLLTHPLAAQLQSCNSPVEVLSVLEKLAEQFDQRRNNDERLRNWLNPTVKVLYTFSASLGEGVGLVFSPAKVIFTGIGVLLLAAKDVDAGQDILVDLFGRIENFFRRVEAYTEVPPTAAMTDIIIKIMVEVLSILAIATKDIKQRRAKKYVRMLLGKNDIEDALRRLDTLSQEEVRMATAEVLKVTHRTDENMEVALDGIQQTKSKVDDLKRRQLRQELRNWLSPPDPSTNHTIAYNTQHEGTSTWFFEGSIYKEWKSNSSLLWIYGKPGSGKSVLCSAIIQDIIALRESGLASMAYFYCDFRDDDKQNRRNIALSILSQLSNQSDVCVDALSHLYSVHDDGAQKPSDGALIQCLKEVLALWAQGPVYLIVDALDECPHNSGMPSPREQVLDLVKVLADSCLSNLHICLTSRPEIDIRNALEPLTSFRISLHEQSGQKKDIIEYVNSVVHSDTLMRRWREDDKRLVIEILSERADGMFRWVYCQLEALRYCLPPSVRGILDELPETLDETYERILRDINKANREHARRLLQCLTVSVRPLRVEELVEVLAVDFDAARRGDVPKLNPDWRWADQHQAVLSTCSSLIAIVDDGHSQVVQFSHFSVKEFLTSDRLAGSSNDVSRYHILLSSAHTILAQACLGVLLRLDKHVNSVNARDIPLVAYAAQYWVDHAQFENVSSQIQDVMEYFFDENKPHWAAWLRVYNIDKSWEYFTPNKTSNAAPSYYAALCGFYDLTERLIVRNPAHVNARGGQMVTPLMAALRGNYFPVADLLHRYGADVNVRGKWEATLLHSACRKELGHHFGVVQWLLSHGVDVNAQNEACCVPLHFAALNGCAQMCQMLLRHNANINARDNCGRVPLHRVANPNTDNHQFDVMQLLLDQGTDVNIRDNVGSTPLHHSSRWHKGIWFSSGGTVEGSRLLLRHGANIDAENNEGKTPLRVALERGHEEMAEFLSGLGAK